MNETCLFCKIIARQIPAQVVFEDEHVLAFRDIRPVAPTHVLIIPKVHFSGLDQARPEHVDALGNVLLAAGRLARELGIEPSGYRTVINTGAEAGQTVFHLHLHLLGGREFTWPPG